MKFSLTVLFLSLFSLFLPLENEWQLEKNEDSLKAYSRIKSGENVKEVRIETTLDVSLGKIKAALLDHASFREWQGGLKNITLLDKISEEESYIYYEVDLPWPMTDRDFIIHSSVHHISEAAVRINMLGTTDDRYPEKDGLVRMTDLSGYWLLEALSDTSTKLTYEFYSDPAGDVPMVLVNAFALDTPFENIKSLKKYLNKF